ncbi:beta-N-acetylglucosaminidase domain-containing protein [Bifidobacterium leontopitheci]|uniref:Hyalurononglucosaminidase n=1 Tax=Bifidobacterium leontopitheci TaxID=2650774 RepID=A0A6I1GGP9_9BIFI|nr:beta-N-acetylglucosaminidase domain-containing protein [Bifidobacterium leontopitheci]KAB7790834.1 hyalurononglucosaminidase [Bifidobacterium leontopitheci]
MRSKALGGLLALAMAITPVAAVGVSTAVAADDTATASSDYTLYPKPHSITYDDGQYILRDINVIYDDGIDEATQDRLDEVAALKNLKVTESDKAVAGKTNVYVGISGSDGKADTAIESKYSPAETTFEKNDSYFLKSDNGTIAVLGKDTDASFYGLTTLYQVLGQLDSLSIRNFTVTDYSDVASRGFIEGYYGNPWSTQDRINLMKFGGYYKMNAYFYAPKDDPKHNAKWRELYTEDELKEKIQPLAEAGNESKTRFVFALHPFMYNAFRFDTDEHYQEDLATLQAKFLQTIKVGVRQIAILADDAANVGGANYTKLLNDMVAWLKEQQKTYPDLKVTLPFVTVEYMYNGESYYQNFPKEVQIVMTGGRIWGEVSQNYVNTFYNNAKRGPFLWINWPCTDNSKDHLIMGGYDTFLHPGVDPEKIQGIMLNPMQQSEPSKVAIFGNATYSWNIWQTKAEADQAWSDSFSFVDHNTAVPTAASNALRELSKHMINQNMDSRVTALQESVDLAPALTAAKEKMTAGTLTADDLTDIKAAFVKLQKAAKTYRAKGNKQLIGETEDYSGANANEQLGPWLDSWDDTTKAALAYIAGIEASLKGDSSAMLKQYSVAQAAYTASKSHGFYYMGETKHAEVGVQHIVPFIKAMDSYLSAKVQQDADPSVVTKTYISNKFNTPATGSLSDIFDGDDSTIASFQTPNKLAKDDYIGVKFSQPITVNTIRFAFGPAQKNHFNKSKLQYTTDGNEWKDVNGEVYDRPNVTNSKPIEATGLNLEGVTAVRLIATEANTADLWVDLAGIDINKAADTDTTGEPYTATGIEMENLKVPNNYTTSHPANYAIDGDTSTSAWFQATDGDYTPANASVIIDLGESKSIGSVKVVQGDSASSTDILDSGKIQVSEDKTNWTNLGDLQGKTQFTVTGNAKGRYVRLLNGARKAVWWRLSEVSVYPATETQTGPYTVTNATIENQVVADGQLSSLYDGSTADTPVVMLTHSRDDSDGDKDHTIVDASITLDLGEAKKIGSVTMAQGQSSSDDIIVKGEVQVSTDGTTFTKFGEFNNAGKDVTVKGTATDARYVRVVNKELTQKWWRVREITVNPPVSVDATKYVYTNLDNSTFTATKDDSKAELSAGTVSLAKGKYVGLDLGAITKLKAATLTVGDAAGLKLQSSDNGLVWSDIKSGDLAEGTTARYIRVVNTADAAATATITAFNVTLDTIGVYGKMINSDIPVNTSWGTDTRNTLNAFDGDMNTVIKFAGQPSKDNVADFDLGQPIDITSLRIYTSDSQYDYIRDSVIQMSADGENWVDAFTIGDGVADTDVTSSFGSISDPAKKTDSQYPNVLYYGKDDIANGKGMRYLRIKATANYPVRALAFNEFMVNKGAYVSTETNAAFSATVTEERGHTPSAMLDGDLTTTYKPSAANGSLTYKIGDPAKVKSFRFVQSGDASDATVTGQVYDATSGKVEDVTFGTLSQAINAFNVPDGKQLVNVKVTWTDKIPEISEFITVATADAAADVTAAKTALKAELDKTVDTATWTADSKSAYEAAKAAAQKVYDSPQAAVASIDSAKQALASSVESAVTKADAAAIAALQKLVDEALNNDDHYYTGVTFAAYSDALDEVKEALKSTDNLSAADAADLKKAVDDAIAALKYSDYQRELATIAVEDFATISADDYTTDSYNALKSAKDAVQALIDATDTKPSAFAGKVKAYNDAKAALVNVVELKAQIAHESNYKEADYTAETWKAYADALKTAKAALVNGTTETVAAALAALKTAENGLERTTPAPDTTELDQTIADMEKISNADGEYTTASFKALTDAIAKAKSDKAKEDAELNTANIKAMKDAKAALVSVVALRAKVAEAGKIDAGKYTTASYAKLAALLAAADAGDVKGLDTLYASGTVEEIAARVAAIDAAVKALAPAAKTADIKAYVDGIKVVAQGDYTDASYKAYVDAYNALKALAAKGQGEVSLAEFDAAKAAFEAAAAKLTLKPVDDAIAKRKDDLLAKIPADLSGYTADSAKKVTDLVAKIKAGKWNVTNQDELSKLLDQLEAAVKGLKLADTGKPGAGNKDVISKTGADVQGVAIIAAIVLSLGLAGVAAASRRRA